MMLLVMLLLGLSIAETHSTKCRCSVMFVSVLPVMRLAMLAVVCFCDGRNPHFVLLDLILGETYRTNCRCCHVSAESSVISSTFNAVIYV